MSTAIAAVLPAAVDMRQDPGVASYLWSDLLARRNALAMHREDLVDLLEVDWAKYRDREDGSRPVSESLIEELLAMEEFVRAETDELLATAPAAAGAVTMQAVIDQGDFERRYPEERTLRDGRPYPMLLHDVAVGRAAAELTRRGYTVEVCRGDRRADLTVRRRACGLLKKETADLLGIAEKKYNLWESGKTAPAVGLLAELQAIDDLITATTVRIDVTRTPAGVNVIHMLDDQTTFEQAYPNARTIRDGTPYPLRVHRVAAARRASIFEGAGEEARIGADSDERD